MTPFLLIFFAVYGLMHFYAFLKARAGLGFGLRTGVPLAVFMLVMILAPVIVRTMEKAGHELIARIMSYVGYAWLGLLFLFISAALAVDFYRVFLSLTGFVARRNFPAIGPSDQFSFLVPLAFSLVISIYGFFEAREIRTERLIVRTSKIPKEVGKLKVVQISDVHLGLIVRDDRLGRALKKVKEENPDILVSTGDLVDGQINGLEGLAAMLREINPKYGKFAITGNHEYYAGLGQALAFTKSAGFEMLRGRGVTVNGMINIVGVDDPTARYFDKPNTVRESELLAGFPRDKFTLFLKHRPFIDKSSIGLYDLQISGHTHKGQIFPFSLITDLFYRKDAGLLALPEHSFMYVSRGTGTWGPPIRFLSPPEVTVIEIVHDDNENRIEKQ